LNPTGEQELDHRRLLTALKEARARIEALRRAPTEPIAIVGLGCRFPGGADHAQAYWSLLRDGVDATSEVPADRWDVEALYDPDPDRPGTMYARRGGFLSDVDQFAAAFFGIAPREAVAMDPQHRLLLEVAWEALEHAGRVPDRRLPGRTGVFVGITTNDYLKRQAANGKPGDIDAYYISGNHLNAAAGRISYVLGLQGPCLAVDTACSSSLVAVDLACSSLRRKQCDQALAGGVNLILSPENSIAASRAKMISSDGRCKTFDANADGYGRGEGCGIVVLRRLSDAVQDGDQVLAVIWGSAVNQDGASSGFTVPHGPAQQALIRQALEQAGVAPSEIDYVEAHGTGTPLGDPVEISALAAALGEGRSGARPLSIASVKTNIGHLESAAGVAGLIKVVLALQHEEIPPHLHFCIPNPHIPWNEIPIHVVTRRTPWPRGEKRRLAGLSSFGMSGTNAHLVIGDAPGEQNRFHVPPGSESSPRLSAFPISAKSAAELKRLAERFCHYLESPANEAWEDRSYTAGVGRAHFAYRLIAIADSSDDLRDKLTAWSAGGAAAGVFEGGARELPPRVVYLFAGANEIDRRGVARLYLSQPAFREALQYCAAIGHPVSPLTSQSADTDLVVDWLVRLRTHTATFVVEFALARLWSAWGIEAEAAASLAAGSFAAACAAGATDAAAVLGDAVEQDRASIGLPRIPLISVATVDAEHACRELHEKGYDVVIPIEACRVDEHRLLELMSAAYASGCSIDWASFFAGRQHRRVALPTYAFQRQRYWYKASLAGSPRAVANPDGQPPLHPLLGQRLRLPASAEIRFQVDFSRRTPPYMDDHRLYGMMIAPGASHIAMVLTAAKEALGADACVIETLFFPQALVLSDQQARTVQLMLKREEGRSYALRILSLDHRRNAHEDEAWNQHAAGVVRLAGTAPALKPPGKIDVERIKARCHRFVPGERFHGQMWDAGYTLGAPFRWIAEVWRAEEETLCRMEAPRDVAAASTFQLYPGLIDSCFQSLLIDIARDLVGREYLFVPFHLERFTLHAVPCPEASLYCHTVLRASDTADSDSLAGDLVLFDEVGTVFAEIKGLEIRKASRKLLRQYLGRDVNELLYQTVWQERRFRDDPPTAVDDAGSWLIVSDTGTVGERLAHKIRQAGGRCYVVRSATAGDETPADDAAGDDTLHLDADDIDSYRRVLNDVAVRDGRACRGIVHLLNLDGDTTDSFTRTDLEVRLERSCGTVLRLLQAITHSGWTRWPQLSIVTRGAQLVRGDQAILDPVQSPVWGMAGVMAMEHPDLQYRCLDLDPTRHADEAAILFEELGRNQAESQVGYRQGSRYVARLARYSVEAAVDNTRIRADGSYLITGGLGGIGLTLAEWMAARGARHLILVGRNKPSAAALTRIQKLRAAGTEVSFAQADVADFEALRCAMNRLPTSKSQLRGIIHAAGVLDDGALGRQTWDRFLRVMAPKAAGAWNLHLLSLELSLDFFVCFSSVAATLGALGQGNYAAANAFMDALMQRRKLQGLPGLSINWGPWAEVGMAAALDTHVRDGYAAAGLGMLTPPQGVRVIEALLGQAIARVGVWPVDWSKFTRAWYRGDPPPYLQIVAPVVTPPANEGMWMAALASESVEKRPALLESYVRRQIADALGLEDERAPGPRERFFDLGLDSLMAVDLKNQLQLRLGRTLRSTVVFDHPTLQALVNHLITDVVPSVFPMAAETTSVAGNGAAPADGIDDLSQDELAHLLARELAEIRQNELK